MILPLGSRVLVRPVAQAETTPGGIVIPDRVDQPDVQGLIVAVGPVVRAVLVGEHVIFPFDVGQELRLPTGRLLIMDEQDVAAVVVDADEPICPLCGRAEEVVCR